MIKLVFFLLLSELFILSKIWCYFNGKAFTHIQSESECRCVCVQRRRGENDLEGVREPFLSISFDYSLVLAHMNTIFIISIAQYTIHTLDTCYISYSCYLYYIHCGRDYEHQHSPSGTNVEKVVNHRIS